MMEVNTLTLAWLGGGWAVFSAVITVFAWVMSRTRVDAPLAVTICVLLLAFFPPLNLLAVTLLSARNRKGHP